MPRSRVFAFEQHREDISCGRVLRKQALTQLGGPEDQYSQSRWKPLLYFCLYRTTIASLFLVLLLWDVPLGPATRVNLELFRDTAIPYLAFSILSVAAFYWQRPAFDVQVFAQVFVDIVALTMLMHASGGVSSGFGILLIVTIAGGSILAEGRIAILFAAMASLSVLGEQIQVWLKSPYLQTQYPLAGILGATFFVTAFLAFTSARRIRTSEMLAAQREGALADLSKLNEHIIQRMQSGIVAVNHNEEIRLMNESAQAALGLSRQHYGKNLRDCLPGLAVLLQIWRDNKDRGTHLFQVPGTKITVMASFAALGHGNDEVALVFIEDAAVMTQRANQLKLASLGRLTASIAHEIRNPLSAISHAGQLLGESGNLDATERRLTHIIRDNSLRMDNIIDNVQQLSRGKAAEPTSLLLHDWLTAFAEEFRNFYRLGLPMLESSVEPNDLAVRVDPSQLHQVVWNLCENGVRHAEGALAMELRAGVSADTHRPFLDVRDNGSGIDSSDLEHIFEPFYTTRSDGTGLGLYISRELCEGNQAALDHIETERGCCFRITFADPRRQGAQQL